jgi:hypothetical protein
MHISVPLYTSSMYATSPLMLLAENSRRTTPSQQWSCTVTSTSVTWQSYGGVWRREGGCGAKRRRLEADKATECALLPAPPARIAMVACPICNLMMLRAHIRQCSTCPATGCRTCVRRIRNGGTRAFANFCLTCMSQWDTQGGLGGDPPSG